MAKEVRRIGLGLVFGWLFGVLFAFGGLSMLFSGVLVGGLALVVASLLLLPPVSRAMREKLHVDFSRGLRIFLVIILFVVYAVSLSYSDLSTSTNIGSGVEETLPSESESAEGQVQESVVEEEVALESDSQDVDSSVYQFGERIELGDFAYTFVSTREVSSVGNVYFGDEADGVFLIVNLEIENIADRARHINNKMYLLDDQGREFEQDGDAWVHLDNNLVFEELNPGLVKSGQIIFDVPQDFDGRIGIKSSAWSSSFDAYVLL